MRPENRLWNLGNLFVLILVLLSARLVYWPLVRGKDLQPVAVSLSAALKYAEILREQQEIQQAIEIILGGSATGEIPQPVIQRTLDLLSSITRGSILDRNGRVLAYDVGSEETRTRIYTEPSLAHVLGYVSGLRTGISGLELTYNESLLGLDRLDSQIRQATHQEIIGSDLVLTLDSYVQRVAMEALGEKAGAIVVLDADTGAVLALASTPSFDPNQILDPGYLQEVEASCDQPTCSGVLLNRATQALYTPGSTFKTLTLIAALDTGQVTPETVFDFGKQISGPNGKYYVYETDGGVIPDPNHAESKLNLEMSYAKSANAAFARIGDEMPAGVLVDYASRFFFSVPPETVPPFEIEYVPSRLANDLSALYDSNLLQASTAIGQGELLTNPFSMAMMVLAVVNDGVLPLPYFVEEVRAPDGDVLQTQPSQQVVRQIMSPETAHLVQEMMITVVEKGSGKSAQVTGATVGGKTGTAQVGGDQAPHAWFIGFAETEARRVVIAVVVENAGQGHTVAAPMFAKVAEAALNELGRNVEEVVEAPPVPQEEQDDPPTEETPGFTLPAPEILRDPAKLDIVDAPGTCLGDYTGPQGNGTFLWPVDPPYRKLVGDDFIPRHPGIDLGTPTGVAVYAADTGVVIFANWSIAGYGNTVVLDHGNGYRTLYAHLGQIGTSCGAILQAGEVLGLADSTGNSSGPHLHFEIRVPGGYLNPWLYLPPP